MYIYIYTQYIHVYIYIYIYIYIYGYSILDTHIMSIIEVYSPCSDATTAQQNDWVPWLFSPCIGCCWVPILSGPLASLAPQASGGRLLVSEPLRTDPRCAGSLLELDASRNTSNNGSTPWTWAILSPYESMYDP